MAKVVIVGGADPGAALLAAAAAVERQACPSIDAPRIDLLAPPVTAPAWASWPARENLQRLLRRGDK